MEVELKNMTFKTGDKLKIQGKIHSDANRFQIDMGADAQELALHFNPRFRDEAVLVCNSKHDGHWGEEQRESHNCLEPGSTVKIIMKHAGNMFEVELPDGQEIHFPNREAEEVIRYIRVTGDFQLTSFKMS